MDVISVLAVCANQSELSHLEDLFLFPASVLSPTIWTRKQSWPSSLLGFPLIGFGFFILLEPFSQ